MSNLGALQKVTPLSPSAGGEWLMLGQFMKSHSHSGHKDPQYPPSCPESHGWVDKNSNNINIYLVLSKFKHFSK